MQPNNQASGAPLRWRPSFQLLCLLFIGLIVLMLLMWKPWSAKAAERTVTVIGDTTVQAEPDEFVFYPQYEFKNADKSAALAALTSKNNEIVAKLKSLGVADKDIKNSGAGFSGGIYFDQSDTNTYNLSLMVTTANKDLAQKVQDYLLTTSPTGSVTPQAQFSEAKRKSLESTARDQASKDARAKADQSAKNLGFKVGKVKSLKDGSGFGDGGCPGGLCAAQAEAADVGRSLTVQPGQNDLSYSVEVVYFIN